MSPELDSESQFTYLPEMEAQATNHEQNGLQPTQPISTTFLLGISMVLASPLLI